MALVEPGRPLVDRVYDDQAPSDDLDRVQDPRQGVGEQRRTKTASLNPFVQRESREKDRGNLA